MRALAIAALLVAGCNQVIGVDKFTSIDASASAPDSAIDATLEFDAPTIDATPAVDARPDASPPDAPTSCGDNTTEPPEQCDTGAVDTSTCDSDCTFPMCGDGHTNTHFVVPGSGGKLEQCDNGASNSDNAGTTCTTHCQLPACGDGIVEAGEGCDDNNKTNGDGCSSNCGVETGYSCSGSPSVCNAVCGDGIVTGTEACDDHNASACGTCNATCSAPIPSTAATGSFNWGGGSAQSTLDGAVIVLDDGINPPTTFEWDNNGNITAGHVAIPFSTGQGGAQTSQAFTNAVNGVGANLLITATSTPPNATLADDRKTSLGNRAIQVMFAGGLFTMTGMTGGSGGDCLTGTGCNVSSDCASGTCTANVCQ